MSVTSEGRVQDTPSRYELYSLCPAACELTGDNVTSKEEHSERPLETSKHKDRRSAFKWKQATFFH